MSRGYQTSLQKCMNALDVANYNLALFMLFMSSFAKDGFVRIKNKTLKAMLKAFNEFVC